MVNKFEEQSFQLSHLIVQYYLKLFLFQIIH